MQVSDFHFDLPDELIARYPQEERTASRLLKLDGNNGNLADGSFKDVLDLVEEQNRSDSGTWIGFSGRKRVLVHNTTSMQSPAKIYQIQFLI